MRRAGLACLALLGLLSAERFSRTGRTMTDTANRFLQSLTEEQRKASAFPFDDALRTTWHYFPERGFKEEFGCERPGIMFKNMDAKQRLYAQALLAAGLSQAGFIKAMNVISMEEIVKIMEADKTGHRDPERYHFTFYGTPSETGTWAWRVEGHHLVVTFTFENGKLISSSPTMLGANPHEVPYGPHKGMRALSREEDLARSLMKSLNDEQLKQAIFTTEAPYDIVTMASVRARIDGAPRGLPAAKMTEGQYQKLLELIAEYALNVTDEAGAARMEKAKAASRGELYFAWAGRIDRDPPGPVEIGKVTVGNRHAQGNYYRIQSPAFLIEFDNTQNNSNHSHSVWRDFREDFGLDVLAAHHRLFDHRVKAD